MRVALIFILIFITSCKKPEDRTCVKSNGNPGEEVRLLEAFHAIEVNGVFKLKLVEDSSTYCIVKGPKNLIPFISGEIEQGILKLYDLNRCRFLRSYQYEIEVELHGNNWTFIKSLGPTEVYSTDTLYFQSLTIDGKKSANDFNLVLKGDSLFTDFSGPTDFSVSGAINYSYLYHTGTGNIHFYQAYTPFVHAHSRGTGNFFVHPREIFIAEVRNEGNIYYLGNPHTLIKEVTGKGVLLKKN